MTEVSLPKIELRSIDGWQALYINGKKIGANHSLHGRDTLQELHDAGIIVFIDNASDISEDDDDAVSNFFPDSIFS